MARGKRRPVVLVALAALLTVTGCGDAADSSSRSASSRQALDTYVAGDAAFFAQFRPGSGAQLVAPPGTIRVAREQSTVVVTARVKDVRPSRTLNGSALLGVELDVLDIVRGQLQDSATKSVVVEFLVVGPTGVAERADALRKQLPAGESVWFLRWQGSPPPVMKPGAPVAPREEVDARLYGLVHLYGVFIQGPDKVLAPIVDPGDDPGPGFHREASRLGRLSDLVAEVARN